MNFVLPFKEGDRVIELGGGPHPLIRPNLDVAPGPNVDIVADFSRSLPISSASFDGILCKFVLEHISWKKVKLFLAECHRILAPGGTVVFITANLLEQCRALVEAPEWNEDLICMLFGGQDVEPGKDWYSTWYPEAHHCGFSPRYAEKLLREAGFCNVAVSEWPGAKTDMIIVALKSRAEVRYSL